MKNLIAIFCLAGMVNGSAVSAQQAGHAMVVDSRPSMYLSAYHNGIHTRAMRDFVKRNKTVEDAAWMVVENGYVVKYTGKNNMNCKAVYNSHGKYSYTLKQYDEKNMPASVRALVKSQYYDYSITLVEEIEMLSKPVVYVVHLQDATTLKNLRICEGEMEMIAEYQKAEAAR